MDETISTAPEAQADTFKALTWDDVLAAPVGHIFLDRFDDGLRFLIMRGPVALCAYVGVPEAHPLAGYDYDNLPIRAHGGLTYSSDGAKSWPKGYWWYGWDYAHLGDFCVYDEKYKDKPTDDQRWIPKDVEADSWSTIYDFKHLLKLAEQIADKARRKP